LTPARDHAHYRVITEREAQDAAARDAGDALQRQFALLRAPFAGLASTSLAEARD